MFETAHEVARVYDPPAWRLNRPLSQMNFSDAQMRQQAQDLAPSPRLITDEDRRIQHRREHRLLIAEAHECAMAEWRQRFAEDVAAKNNF